jgi:hypothetical protein
MDRGYLFTTGLTAIKKHHTSSKYFLLDYNAVAECSKFRKALFLS